MRFVIHTKKYIEESSNINEFTCGYTHIPQSKEIEEVRGNMYSIINLKGPKGLDAVTGVNVFLDKLEELYFSSMPMGIPAILERTVKTALFELNAYLENLGIIEDIIFDFACAAIKEDVLYIAKVEEAYIYLIRDNKALNLGGSLRDVANPKLVETGSGILQSGDKVIMSNAAGDELISDWNLLSRYSESEMTRLISGQKGLNTDNVAFLVVEIEKPLEILSDAYVPEIGQKTEPVSSQQVAIPHNLTPVPDGDIKKKIPVIGNQFVGIGDRLGEKIITVCKNLGKRISSWFLFLYTHRGEVVPMIQSTGQKMKGIIPGKNSKKRTFTPLGQKKLTENEEGKSNLSSSLGGVNMLEPPRRRRFEKIKKNKRFIVPAVFIVPFFAAFLVIVLSNYIHTQQKQTSYKAITSQISQDIRTLSGATNRTTIDVTYATDTKLLTQAYALHLNTNALDMLKNQLDGIEAQAHNEVLVKNPIVLADLSLGFPTAAPTSLDIVGSTLLAASPGNNAVYTVDTHAPSSGSKINASLVSDPVSVCSLNETTGLIYDKNNGILEYSTSGALTAVSGLADIKNIASITTFENNIYFLDPTDQIIYKSVPVGEGYSLASSYITDVNLSNATGISVDGNVFVSSPTQGITRYYARSPTPFSVGNTYIMGKNLGPVTYLYDNEHLTNIYLLDPQNSRIVVLAKPTGADTITYPFLKQYIYTGNQNLFNDLKAVCVDITEKNMYLVDGAKILKISL